MNEAELFAFYEEQNTEVYENTAPANAYAGACRCRACLSKGWHAPPQTTHAPPPGIATAGV